MKIKRTLQYGAALALVALVLALLLDQVIMPSYVRQGQVRYLPNVVGLSLPEAVAILKEGGFGVADSHYVAHTREYPPNQVFEMYPKAYSRVKKGRIVQLTVTQEEKMVEVPQLVAKSLRAAEIEVARAGLLIDTVHTTYSDDFAAGTITWQSPRGGNLLRRGGGISLMVSMGQAPLSYYVPSVVGMGFQAGRREILDAGLEIGRVKYLYAPNLLPNTIIDQSIAGGTVLKVKRALNLTVSTYDPSKE
ncbi:MAG: PASTA domain-containing protein [Fidelibacterota bacterium]|nr:MAG: PASTA domain-containing protein [Candidatus Neomarinimicrobiota bacterium]